MAFNENNSHDNQGDFIERSLYEKLLTELAKFNGQADPSDKYTYLKTYNEVLDLRRKAFPLLLREGEAHIFDTPPVNAYLLPPLEGLPSRWVLVFFVTETGQSQVQIMDWPITTNNPDIKIQPLANQLSPCDIEGCTERLDMRPEDIFCSQAGTASCTIHLVFSKGDLILVVSPKKGILSITWQQSTTNSANNTQIWIERYSFGSMDKAVKIRRYEKSQNWQDDSVLGIHDDNHLLADNRHQIGRIRGGDGPQNQSNFVYLASSRFRVYRVDKNRRYPLVQSVLFTDSVLDVLVINQANGAYVLLATIHNGALFLLRDTNPATCDEKAETIKITHWQFCGCPIFRLIGFGDKRILSLDERGRLTPLYLVKSEELKNRRNDATEKLFALLEKDIGDFLNWPETLLGQEARFLMLGKLVLEYFLQYWETPDRIPPDLWMSFEHWCRWLNWYYRADVLPNPLIVSLHEYFIRRIFYWMQKFCFLPLEQNFVNKSPSLVLALNIVGQLLKLNPDAPDELWALLLRKSDWVFFWAQRLGLVDSPDFTDSLQKLKQLVGQQRLKFSPALYRIRGFYVRSSYRFWSQPSYIEVLDEKQPLIAVLEANRGLCIVKFSEEHREWQELARAYRDRSNMLWQGQPMFVKHLPSPQQNIVRLLVGTQRGELVILNWRRDNQEISVERKRDYDFAMMCYLKPNPDDDFHLLAGQSKNGVPCIYILPNSYQLPELKPFWTDTIPGTIRMLCMNKSRTRLWAIDRENGELLSWPISWGVVDKRLILGPIAVWLKSAHKLHRLGYAQEHNLLVCGGQAGLVHALDAETGALKWVVNVAGRVRHLAYVDGVQGEGVWLLSGDDKSSLAVRKDGTVAGAIEQAGSASTFATFKNGLLMGTLDGRLVLLNTRPPEEDYVSSGQVLSTHPLRYSIAKSEAITDQELTQLLKNNVSNESIVAFAVLRHCLNYLRHPETEMSETLAQTFWCYWARQTHERKIVFLYDLRSLLFDEKTSALNDSKTAFIYQLIGQCWEYIAGLKDSSLLCKIVSPLFDMLQRMSATTCPQNAEAWVLLSQLRACVWQHHKADECRHCLVLQKGQALIAIRLNQALKLWNKTNGNEATRLFAWCNALVTETGAPDLDTLRSQLQKLLANNLFLLGQDNSWQRLLSNITHEESLLPDSEANPLSSLHQPQEGAYDDRRFSRLLELFPKNSSWQLWLRNLQVCLQALQRARLQQPHEAWRERAAWRGVREHIIVQGTNTFTSANQQTLLALWWPSMQTQWRAYIDGQLQALEKKVSDAPSSYLGVEPKDRWHTAYSVEITLKLTNRFPYPLNLQALTWEQSTGVITKVETLGLPTQLAADEFGRELTFMLPSQQANELRGNLTLACVDAEFGRSVNIPCQIDFLRNLTQLSNDLQWQPTWQRLKELLLSCAEQQQKFHWLNGDSWVAADRELLAKDILDKYGLKIDHLPHLSLDKAQQLLIPVFSPDIALAATPQRQLEQLHAVVQKWAGLDKYFYYALTIWEWARPDSMTDEVRKALAGDLPDTQLIAALLKQLFVTDERLKAIAGILHQLPCQAIGSWCSCEPFYALKPGEEDLVGEIYLPAASLFKLREWEQFDRAHVSDEKMSRFLGVSVDQAKRYRQDRNLFFSVANSFFSDVKQALASNKRLDTAAQLLLGKLGAGSVQFRNPVWLMQMSVTAETAITLNWQDYHCVYLLPKISAINRASLSNYPEGIWLALGETVAPSGLPGASVAISKQDALGILHTSTQQQAMLWLNRIAAAQSNPQPERTFRSELGMGSLVEKHFYGREPALLSLWNALKEADRPNGAGSALLVGGRRMGKTSLRQRIMYEVSRNQPQRICVEFNFEGKSDLDTLSGIELERWFFEQLTAALADKTIKKFAFSWSKEKKDNSSLRDDHRNKLRNYLNDLKTTLGYAVLWTFDETEHLIRADARNKKEPYSLFGFFRSLIQEGLLCLFATSYPYNANVTWALNIAKYDSNSPTYNTFSSNLELTPWEPSIAWNFLQSRLAGLGILLPRYYREEMLDISRGIPWLVHEMGKTVCLAVAKQQDSNRIVDAALWQQVKNKTIHELEKSLKQPIEQTAELVDRHFLTVSTSQADERLGNEQLWHALIRIARNKPYPTLLSTNDWPEPASFSLEELHANLPKVKLEVLQEALTRLSSSFAIEGVSTGKNRYVLAGNLLQVWLHHQGEM